MTSERARQVLDTRTLIGNVWVPILDVGSADQIMSPTEIEYVRNVWADMPGSSTFVQALTRIANSGASA